jgi:hypothetical protein
MPHDALAATRKWRFWALVALAVIDGVFFIIPMVATALVADANRRAAQSARGAMLY